MEMSVLPVPGPIFGLTATGEMSEAPGSTRYDAVPLSSEQQTRFVSENQRRVFLLIYRIVGNVDDAQDLTQESFIKALQRQDQLKDLDKAAHWLSRIASNTAIDFLRRSGRMNFSGMDDLPEPVTRSREESPEQQVLRTEHREYLETGLALLTGRERTALLLRDVEGLPAEEVAAMLNCSKATSPIAHRQRSRKAPAISRSRTAWGACMKRRHVSETDLALYVSGDLAWWRRFTVRLHVDRCEPCRRLMEIYEADRAGLRGFAA